ncbi:MAG: cytochrome b N-terminal domain-containing protein [Syntrophobacteraceae bacterium]|nr:cytochrome b N-terminal domain-containing protein [Syntrophobacteraceae bacterium]
MKQRKKLFRWLDDRTGLVTLIESIAAHPAAPGVKWKYVFGSAVLTAFILQVVTGIGLLTTYVSSTGGAFESLQYITRKAPLGAFLRGMHYWGASMMVILIVTHLLRVFLMGSFKFPRELNWVTGVLLLAATLAMAFCGQIMRWDQNAVFGLVAAAKMAGHVPLIGPWLARFIIGGDVVGSYTLSRIFDMHVFVLPILLVSLIGLHVHLVLRNGVSEPPVPGRGVDPATYRSTYRDMLRRDGVPFWPTVVLRDFVFALCVVLVVLLLAWVVGPARLDNPPDPSLINAQPRPDWYFWWLFALLALLPHALENYFMVLTPLVIGLVLLSVPLVSNRGERHPGRRPLAVAAVVVILSGIAALTVAGWHEDWSPRVHAPPLTANLIGVSSGPVYEGAMVFNKMGCLFCHTIEGHGGKRGPDLTEIADELTRDQLTLRIMNGAYNMPVFGRILSTEQTENLLDFLATRKKSGFAIGKKQ